MVAAYLSLLLPFQASAASVCGRILDPSGHAPKPGFAVLITTMAEDPVTPVAPVEIARAIPGKDGSFVVFFNDRQGDYRLLVEDRSGRLCYGIAHIPPADDTNVETITVSRDRRIKGTAVPPPGSSPSDIAVVAGLRLQSSECHHYVPVATATTDNAGSFLFRDLSPGEYDISVRSDLYCAQPTTVTVAASNQAVELFLGLAASFHGVVRDINGQPIPGVTLQTDRGAHVITDSIGKYVINGLPDGETFLTLTHPLHAAPYNESVVIHSEAGQVTEHDFMLVPVGKLTMTMVVSNGPVQMPLSVRVNMVPVEETVGPSGYDHADVPITNGMAVLQGIAPGTYAIGVHAPGIRPFSREVTVLDGPTNSIDVVVACAWSIQGTVTDSSGKPVHAADIVAWPRDQAENSLAPPADGSCYARSRKTGHFILEDLAPGNYRFEVRHPGYLSSIGTFRVESGSNVPVTIVLPDGLAVRGTVRMPADTASSTLEVVASTLDKGTGYAIAKRALVDRKGRFEITGLETGSYTIAAYVVDNGTRVLLARIRGVEAGREDIIFSPGEQLVVSGIARDIDGEPVPALPIHVIPVDSDDTGQSLSIPGETDRDRIQCTTDNDGRFFFTVQPRFCYRLDAWRQPYLPWTTNLDYTLLTHTPPTNCDIRLAAGLSVSGIVCAVAQTVALSNIEITARPDSYQSLAQFSDTDDPFPSSLSVKPDGTGRFLIKGLPDGMLNLELWASGADDSRCILEKQVFLRGQSLQLRLSIPALNILTGSVLTPAGKPLQGCFILLSDSLDPEHILEATSDVSGGFTFADVPDGYYILTPAIQADSGTSVGRTLPVALTDGTATNVTLRIDTAYRMVDGIVKRHGTSVSSVTVGLMPVAEGSGPAAPLDLYGGEMQARTDATGHFSIGGLQPGSYVYYIYPARLQDGDPDIIPMATFCGMASVTQGQDRLTLDINGTQVSGCVTRQRGESLAEAMVSMNPTGLSRLMREAQTRWTRVNPSGRFEIDCVESGSYDLIAYHEDGRSSRTQIVVHDSPVTTSLEIVTGTMVEATVNDITDNPVCGAALLAVSIPDSEPVAFGVSDENGHCAFEPGIPDGSWRILVVKPGYAVGVHTVNIPQVSSLHTTLVPGGQLTVQVEPEPDTEPSGNRVTLTTSGGKPVYRMPSGQAAGGILAMATVEPTNQHGLTRVHGLEPGGYTVRVEGIEKTIDVVVGELEDTLVLFRR